MIRGAVYWVNLTDTHPPEFGKTRPALILSNSEQNAILSTVVAMPISTRPPEIWPLRLALPALPGLRKSFVAVTGIRQIAKNRLLDQIGILPSEKLDEVLAALTAYLSE